MKHPNPTCQKSQEDFLNSCPEEEREFHAQFFRIGNATYIYHEQAAFTCEKRLREYYAEWLQGLPANIAGDMKKKDFEQCKNIFPFTRYVNERNDIGLRDWMREHLSQEDYDYFLKEQTNELF